MCRGRAPNERQRTSTEGGTMDTTTPTTPGGTTDRAIVGVFDDRPSAERAVDALYQAGFTDDHIGFAIRGADDVRGGMIVDAEGTKDGKGALTGAVTGGVLGGVLAAAIAVLLPGVGP